MKKEVQQHKEAEPESWVFTSSCKCWYLFIVVKSHELDGSIRKNPDHHRPIALVQAQEAFFLWHSFERGKHS